MRSIVTAMVVGGLCTVACKKSDNAAKEEKVQEAPAPTPASHKEPAPAAKTAAPGVAAGGIQHDDKEGPAAILTQAKGSVEVRRLGETQYAAAQANTKLYAGDTLRTGDAASATVALADQSVIEVGEISTIGVGSRNGTADPASSAAVLDGVARFTVTPRAPGEGPFRVYTDAGVIITRGTTYGVGVAASGEARVGVENGTVDVLGIAQLDGKPVAVAKGTQLVLGADGKLGTVGAWPNDDWGTWRDEADAKLKLDAALDMHGEALADLSKALADTYGELQVSADGAATFEASAAAAAEKKDPAAYKAAQADGAVTIDASFLLAARLETLTWAYAGHAALATDLYVRHPAELEAKWTAIAPSIDAAVLWPKRFEITGVAYFEPLRTQYYIHHPVGRAHAALVGIAVPEFYAQVEPPQIDPITVRGKLKGQVWIAPEMSYHASARPIWIGVPEPTWNANLHVAIAPPRAKVDWYVRPPTLKANALVGANITGKYASKLDVKAPEPRVAIAAGWTVPVGLKIKVAPPDLAAAANARAHVKLAADGRLVMPAPAMAVRGDVDAHVKAPDVKAAVGVKVKAPTVKVKVPNVKAGIDAHVGGAVRAGGEAKAAAGGAVKAGTDAKAAVGGAVKAGADVNVKIKPPEVKLKGEAKGGFKIGN